MFEIQHKAWLSRFLSLVCLKIQYKVWLPRFVSLVYLKTQHKVWLSRFFSLVCLKIEHKVWLSWHSDCTYCEENLIVAGRQEEGSTLREAVKYYSEDFFRKRVTPLPLADSPPKKSNGRRGCYPPLYGNSATLTPEKYH